MPTPRRRPCASAKTVFALVCVAGQVHGGHADLDDLFLLAGRDLANPAGGFDIDDVQHGVHGHGDQGRSRYSIAAPCLPASSAARSSRVPFKGTDVKPGLICSPSAVISTLAG